MKTVLAKAAMFAAAMIFFFPGLAQAKSARQQAATVKGTVWMPQTVSPWVGQP